MPCCDFIDDGLRAFFGWLGYQVGKRPGYFIIVPILLTGLCASGFQRMYYEADPEYLFSPINGEAKFERAQLEKHFPTNYSAFDPGRVSRAGRFGRLLISAKDNGTILRERVFQQVRLRHSTRYVHIFTMAMCLFFTDCLRGQFGAQLDDRA